MKPILFNTQMVQAILDGRKTQTRRAIPEKIVEKYYDYDDWVISVAPSDIPSTRVYEQEFFMERAKYSVGDTLWVRETWRPKTHNLPTGHAFEYKATAERDGTPTDGPWKPSIFMPKEACRLFLEVTNVRVEQIQDITWDDAVSEGCSGYRPTQDEPTHQFQKLWDSIKRGYPWIDNPWVWVYEFKIKEVKA